MHGIPSVISMYIKVSAYVLAGYKRLLGSRQFTAEEPSEAKNLEIQKWQGNKGNILLLPLP